jgi:hypothetical protein
MDKQNTKRPSKSGNSQLVKKLLLALVRSGHGYWTTVLAVTAVGKHLLVGVHRRKNIISMDSPFEVITWVGQHGRGTEEAEEGPVEQKTRK